MKPNFKKLLLLMSIASIVATAQEFEWTIPPRYENATSFTDNHLAAVQQNGSWGYINKTGIWVIQPLFTKAEPFQIGLAAVQQNDKWGFINNQGNWMIQPQYENVNSFSESLAGVCKDNWGFIDKTGNYAFEARFENIGVFSEGLAGAQLNGKWGFIDKTGKWVIKPQFKDVSVFKDGLVGVQYGIFNQVNRHGTDELIYKWGFIDKTGAWLIEAKYEDIGILNEGLIAVKLNGKWGYIDKKGNFVIKPVYSNAKIFTNGLAAVCQKGKWGYIDKTGIWVIQLQFDNASDFADKERIAEVQLNGKWGYIERPSISSYIKKVVEKNINEWQKKGEFEKTTEYQKRVNDKTRDFKIQQFIEEALKQLKDEYARKIQWNELKLSEYDADNETYLIKSEKLGDFAVPVPIADAPLFKQSWTNMNFTNTDFTVSEEQFNLAKVTITNPTNGKKYQYDSKRTTTYAANNITYNFAPVEVDIPRNEANLNNTIINKNNTVVGLSDVDINIPINKNVNDKTFAIIIANENYQREAQVMFARNDGGIFKKYCIQTLGLPEKNVHFVENATLNNIRGEINWVAGVANAYKGEANVIFYYAGHGIPDESSKAAYLLPVDGYGSDVTTGYKLDDLYTKLGGLPAKNVTLFMDACFSGSQRSGQMLASARGVAIKIKEDVPQGNMVVFSAAKGDETAYPYNEKGHGLFTYFLLKKLQETKGSVTLGELSNYIATNVSQQSIVVNSKSQTPTVVPSVNMGDGWKSVMLK